MSEKLKNSNSMYTAMIYGRIYVNEKGQKDIDIFSRLDDDIDKIGIFDDVDHALLSEIETEGNFMVMVNAWFEEYRYFDVDEIDIQYEVFEIGKSEKE